MYVFQVFTFFLIFSYHLIAMYDIPAMVDYILKLTGQKSVIYIGHSQGTTVSYVLLSMKPEYNAKFSLVISLSPVTIAVKDPPRLFNIFIQHGDKIKVTGLFILCPLNKIIKKLFF